MKIRVGSIVDLSTIEWPGHICLLIFFAGCNLRCPFCSNSTLIPLDSGAEVEIEYLQRRIQENASIIDSVGVTGGEPSLQPEAIMALFSWAKRVGFGTFLNTNGTNPELVSELARAGVLDYVALDIKAPLEAEAYSRVVGIRDASEVVAKVSKTLEVCRSIRIPMEARTTVVPGLIDDDISIRRIARILSGYGVYFLQEFVPFESVLDPKLRKIRSPSREQLLKLGISALSEGVKEVFIRTRKFGSERVTGNRV
jgi:pyruvate formate lyase activating enzyme